MASLLIATMLVTDVGTVADHDETRRDSGARDVITIAVGTTIIANGAVIEVIDFVAKN